MNPAIAAAALLLAVPAAAAPLTVSIANVKDATGQVRVDVCVKDEFLKDRCRYGAGAAAKAGTVTVTVPDVAPGTYAVQVYHDQDGNGRLKRNFIGIPQEGYGFSNDIRPGFGPPKFDAAAVRLGGDPRKLAVTMRYGR